MGPLVPHLLQVTVFHYYYY